MKIQTLINKILNLGVNESYSINYIKKIRLINGIALIGGSVLILTSVVIIIKLYPYNSIDLTLIDDFIFSNNDKIILNKIMIIFPIIDFIVGLLLLFTLYLNYKKKFNVSSIAIYSISTIFVFLLYFFGKLDIVYFVLFPAILSSLFHTKKRDYLPLWITNYLLFIFFTLLIN